MQNCNPAKMPFSDISQLHKRRDDKEPADATLYREMIGSIRYLLTFTRSDLAFTVSKLSQYLSDPSTIRMAEAKHVLRCVKGTLDYGLLYSAPPDRPESLPICFTNASHATDPDDRKSRFGHLTLMNGGSISHSSGKQPITALSSMEAEYIGSTNKHGSRSYFSSEVIHLHHWQASRSPNDNPHRLRSDIKPHKGQCWSPIHKTHSHVFSFYSRSSWGRSHLQHIPATEQAADVLTKPLSLTKHVEAMKMLKLTTFRYETTSSRPWDARILPHSYSRSVAIFVYYISFKFH